MDHVPARRIYDALASCTSASGAELELLSVISGDECYPPDEATMQIVYDCTELGIDVLYTDATAGPGLLVAGQPYDDVYAVSRLPEGVSPVVAARCLRRQLARYDFLQPEELPLPVSEADLLLQRWSRQVSLIFGSRFAAKLLDKACENQNPGHMTAESLEQVRRYLITATGGCIEFAFERLL